MTVSPVRPISAAEAALRVELAPQPGQILKPVEVAPVVSPQASVTDHIALRMPATPVPGLPENSPEAALAQTVKMAIQDAATRQGGLAPLLADLDQALTSPGLPAPLKAAAARMLASQPSLGAAPTGDELRTAFGRSGLFLEARIAAALSPADGRPVSARAADQALAAQLAAGVDAKAALLVLREALRTWLAAEGRAPPEPRHALTPERPPTPPHREGPIGGQPPAPPSLPPEASPPAIAQRLLQAAGAALAREELLQIASLREAQPGSPAEGARWMFEIPLTTPHGPAVAQFEIARDGGGGASDAEPQPVWRARFAVDFEPLGPVHVHLSLKPGRTAVTLWAEREATATILRDKGGALGQALRAADMIAEIAVYSGAPKVEPAPAGSFVDQAS